MKNLQDLRNVLLEIIPEIRTGKIEVNKANAICTATNSIINLTKLELDFLSSKEIETDFISKPITESLEETLKRIEEKNKEPYKFSNKAE